MQHYQVFQRLYQPYVQGVEVNLLGERAIPMRKIWFMKGSTGLPGSTPSVQTAQ
jgi:hypothetical protein